MDWKKTVSVTALIILVVAMVSITAMPAKAWCWYWYGDHWAVRSETGDIPSNLRPYIEKVEYDAMSAPKMGVRLYLTPQGRTYGLWYNNAYEMARFITSQSYWAGDRSAESVAYEIRTHCRFQIRQHPIHIEYFYADLTVNQPPNLVY